MSRVYDNTALQTVPVKNVNLSYKWKFAQLKSGGGVLLECTIVDYKRFCLTDNTNSRFRYYVFQTKVKRSHKRKFDSIGKEIEPNFSQTHKVNTGYLPSSYKTDPKGHTDKLSYADTQTLLSNPELTELSGEPAHDCLYLWIDEGALDKIEVCKGDDVRVKTAGDGPFIESISKMEGQSVSVSNYAGGDKVGATWTDKIMALKQDDTGETPTQDNGDGAADDEWDD